MSLLKLTDKAAAVATALAKLDVRPDDRVLIMVPDGPGFVESFLGTMRQGSVPLPVNPLLAAHDVVAVAVEAGARLVLASVDRIQALPDLDIEQLIPVERPQGLCAAALRLR